MQLKTVRCICSFITLTIFLLPDGISQVNPARERISINEGWRFMKYTSTPDKLIYDIRPEVADRNDNVVADSKPTEAVAVTAATNVLKSWILPSANDFIKDPAKQHQRPGGNPGSDFPFVQSNFNDASWEPVNLPHDWAIKGPFFKGDPAEVGGGMGRLPSPGVAWYRRKLTIPVTDKDKMIYLDIDGAMSYAMVWLNGNLVGGWPYGYNSFRLNLTPYIKPGSDNQLAIRLDNPANSARWYPGGGLYRNVWLTKLAPVHIAQWGTFIHTKNVSATAATVDLAITLENNSTTNQRIDLVTEIFTINEKTGKAGNKATTFPRSTNTVPAGKKIQTDNSVVLNNPMLWGPAPAQKPNLYLAVTKVYANNKIIDEYETRFGIRTLQFDAEKGLLVNGKPVRIQGVNQHHDLGALGAAFNTRAAERQLELLRELGCNAIRLSHNPPAPELLELTDKMGFLVIDEIFDSWERKKTPHDFHLIFPDWYEPDTRSFIRRDKNHPSIIAWSFGNEVGEQYTGDTGAVVARKLAEIVHDEDSTRPATASMNYAKPDMPFPAALDLLCLNYQGEGIRDAPAYAHLKGIRTSPLYPAFHSKFPNKMIVSSETASTLSSRGTYIFPVYNGISAPVSDSTGGDPDNRFVSAYELYTAAFGASPDKVFTSQDKHPYVAGEFVWSGWDYIGEPTPYYTARSSYSGIIDLAGFKKDRFFLYQARWRPNLPMAHILPHWTWPERTGMITPVHVFTSGDEAELFLNNKSLGRKKKGPYEYRLRWDSVQYTPGTLRVVAYRNGKPWAYDTAHTAGAAAKLKLQPDRSLIKADGTDLSFITLRVTDAQGILAPDASDLISFSVSGPGEIVATDNGDAANLDPFPSPVRNAFKGLALVIVRAKKGAPGVITVTATGKGLASAKTIIKTN
ncbi:beta-galactosidase [Niastella yeongjuensis]|uniref:Beta-galactosidase n=1 Tax=Niastella yeongjuensis TaxID=354355 RepID=A0A1V9EEG1_9BACT|nr:beta-galactosidase GalB [Niastella yeongjuensis]OQP44519.1 beta-galactosidase [Niastella yeongjuensis]SEO84879.1 beta-galactosidase [Niastella yeongjuensis]